MTLICYLFPEVSRIDKSFVLYLKSILPILMNCPLNPPKNIVLLAPARNRRVQVIFLTFSFKYNGASIY